MSQSLVVNYEHIVFSTKHRLPHLSDKGFRQEMHAYLGGVCRELNSPALLVGGVEDHVHLLVRLSKSLSVEQFLREIKKPTSRWAKAHPSGIRQFFWQGGYGAFSISPSHVPSVVEYIKNQEEHHRHETFQDEFRRLLRKYDIEWDERYVWD